MDTKYREHFHLVLYLYLVEVRKSTGYITFTLNEVVHFVSRRTNTTYDATFSGHLLDEALDELVIRGNVNRHSDGLTQDYYYLDAQNYDEVIAFMESEVKQIEVYRRLGDHGDRWLGEALLALEQRAAQEETDRAAEETKSLELERDDDPLSTEAWEPLQIDRGSGTYRGAIDAVEAAAEAIEGSNGYAESEPDERNGIVHTIRGTLRAVKEGFPSRKSIVHGLLVPLRFIATKFTGAAMGEAAKRAVAALITWLFGS